MKREMEDLVLVPASLEEGLKNELAATLNALAEQIQKGTVQGKMLHFSSYSGGFERGPVCEIKLAVQTSGRVK